MQGVTASDGPRDYPYRVIAARLRERVAASRPHDQLPPIDMLADEYGVSPGTVKRALRMLKDEGLVYGVNGLGTFAGHR